MNIKILGIDPGSQATGLGLIEVRNRGPVALHIETLRPPRGLELPDRLRFIYRGAREVISGFDPDLVAVETAFFHKHPRSALVLGQVRGVLVLAAREAEKPLSEVSPREVKLAVTGNGGSSKEQVQFMVRGMLRLKETLPPDAADALAVALCAWQKGKVKP